MLIVWRPSAKLLPENKVLQESIKQLIADGVKVEACIACANMYGVADQLKTMGIEVKRNGIGSIRLSQRKLESTDSLGSITKCIGK